MHFTVLFWEVYWHGPLLSGLSGQLVCDQGPVTNCMDDTKPDGSHPCIVGFICHADAIEMSKLSPGERKVRVAEHYANMVKNNKFRYVS